MSLLIKCRFCNYIFTVERLSLPFYVADFYSFSSRERVRIAQRQNDTVVKSTRCVTLTWRVTLAQRQNDTVCQFGIATK